MFFFHESILLPKLIDYLATRGYPKDALVLEWKIGQKFRADLAVIEPVTNKPIAIFELKRSKTKQNINSSIIQLKNYKNILADEQILMFLVFPKDNDNDSLFEFYLINDDEETSTNEEVIKIIEQIPEYLVLKNSKLRKEIGETKQKQKSTLDWFHIICWGLAIAVLMLLIFEFFEKIKITPERLALIGIIIGLIVVPVASKLKILGVEFERYKKEDSPKQ